MRRRARTKRSWLKQLGAGPSSRVIFHVTSAELSLSGETAWPGSTKENLAVPEGVKEQPAAAGARNGPENSGELARVT